MSGIRGMLEVVHLLHFPERLAEISLAIHPMLTRNYHGPLTTCGEVLASNLLNLQGHVSWLLQWTRRSKNVISPALIETDMVRSDLRITPERIPVGRFGQPQEVAEVAVMLARNGYITGQSINVNGGVYPTS